MSKFFKHFNTHNNYSSSIGSTVFIRPSVSKCIQETHIHYDYGKDTNNHAYVDFDLSSHALWATMNLGATSEVYNGLLYTWGATTGAQFLEDDEIEYGNRTYSFPDYELSLNGYSEDYPYIKKYLPSDQPSGYYATGFSGDELITLDNTDDTAKVVWEGNWRMPTLRLFIELLRDTTNGYVENGKFTKFIYNDSGKYAVPSQDIENGLTRFSNTNGYLFFKQSASSASAAINANEYIFFPAAGGVGDSYISGIGYYGFYWSSSLDVNNPLCSWCFGFGPYGASISSDSYYRCYGYSIRPIIY